MKDRDQVKIRDFGEKVLWLLDPTKRGQEAFFPIEQLPQFPRMTRKMLMSKLRLNTSNINLWQDDNREPHRLPPRLDVIASVAELYGVWPKSKNDESDLLGFWAGVWPSWYSGPAEDQFSKQGDPNKKYKRPKNGDGKPDSCSVFEEEYRKQLNLYIKDPDSSLLYFGASQEREALTGRALEDLIRLLSSAPQALLHLKRQPRMAGIPFEMPSNGAVDEALIRDSANFLLEALIDDVIHALQQSIYDIRQEPVTAHSNSIAAVLIEIAQRLVPATYDAACVANVKRFLDDKRGELLEVSVHHKTVAEILIAAAEARSTRYMLRSGPHDYPAGTRSFLDHSPDCGFDAADQETQAVLEQITRPFSATSLDEIEKLIRKYVAGSKIYTPDPTVNFSSDTRLKMVGLRLENLIKKEKKCFYMLFRQPKQESDRQAMQKMVERLSKDLPGMLFLALTNHEAVAMDEVKRFDPFILMLPAADGADSR